MVKRDLIKMFIDEIYSKAPKKNYPTNKILYNHIDEIWTVDLADMNDYKISNNKVIDTYSLSSITSVNFYGPYHLKINIVNQ